MTADILIIDDDRYIVQAVKKLLERHGFGVRSAGDFDGGLQSLAAQRPDLLILDLGLPDGDGVALCRRIRTQWRFPILMLTSRSDAMDKVVGLEVGADDYLTKPFEAAELLARVRALLRRAGEYQLVAPVPKVSQSGPVQVDHGARSVKVNGQEMVLTEKEYQLLAVLVDHAGQALNRGRLFELVWGYDIEFSSNTLDVFVYRLRGKLEDAGAKGLLQTVRGFGYRLAREPG